MYRSLSICALALALIAGGDLILSRSDQALSEPILAAGAAHAQSAEASDPAAAGDAQQEETGESAGTPAAQDDEAAPDSEIVEMVLGDENAPLTVVEYASFTCPHCATFHNNTFKNLRSEYIDTGKVRFIFREVYFDRYGLWASMIARCGGEERFFGITDLIFKGQSDWVRAGGAAEIVEELRKIGRLAGLDETALESCMQDGDKAQALVEWYQQNAEADDIRSTPSFVIDGEQYENMAWDEFKAILDERLDTQ